MFRSRRAKKSRPSFVYVCWQRVSKDIDVPLLISRRDEMEDVEAFFSREMLLRKIIFKFMQILLFNS